MIISMIAAVDADMGIGKGNRLLCHLPGDLKRFKQITMGKPIIMGRKTYESIGKPLPGRENIVISTTMNTQDGITVFANISDALNHCENCEEVMIIGGARIYQQMIHKADKIYLTHIDASFEADAYFPHVDEHQWDSRTLEKVCKDSKNPYSFKLIEYQKR